MMVERALKVKTAGSVGGWPGGGGGGGGGGGERECEGRPVLEGVDAVFCWAKPAMNTAVANIKWQF